MKKVKEDKALTIFAVTVLIILLLVLVFLAVYFTWLKREENKQHDEHIGGGIAPFE